MKLSICKIVKFESYIMIDHSDEYLEELRDVYPKFSDEEIISALLKYFAPKILSGALVIKKNGEIRSSYNGVRFQRKMGRVSCQFYVKKDLRDRYSKICSNKQVRQPEYFEREILDVWDKLLVDVTEYQGEFVGCTSGDIKWRNRTEDKGMMGLTHTEYQKQKRRRLKEQGYVMIRWYVSKRTRERLKDIQYWSGLFHAEIFEKILDGETIRLLEVK
jgi:hypothetical protein